MEPVKKPKILCVDDEPAVLDGLMLNLRRKFDVQLATSGMGGLEVLGKTKDIAVIISDMRMPSMDGATFLTHCREVAPDATRMLLTGQSDIESAVAAINEGRIFRFLHKPCAPDRLIEAVEAAVEQHRLVTAERVLLEQTLNGAINALADVLAQTHPKAFGRALRVKRLAGDLAVKVDLPHRWQVDVAATLSQVAAVTLPGETLDALEAGHNLAPEEVEMVNKMPGFTDKLLANIPRLEGVRAILSEHGKHPRSIDPRISPEVAKATRVLRIAMDYDRHLMQGLTTEVAIGTMRSRGDAYDTDLLNAFADLCGTGKAPQVKRMPLHELKVGMVLGDDLRTNAGVLLAARGYLMTAGFIARLANFKHGAIKEPITVILSEGDQAQSAA